MNLPIQPRTMLKQLLGLGLLLSVMVLPSSVRAQTQLRWKFAPGQKLEQKIDQVITIDMKLPDGPVQTSVKQTIQTRWEVNAVADDGTAEITQTITRIQMAVKEPRGEFNIDTNSEEPLDEGTEKNLGVAMKILVGEKFQVKMNALGGVVDVTVSDEMTKALKNTPGGDQLATTFSSDGLKSLLAQSLPYFKKEGVAQGDKWTQKYSAKVQPVGTVDFVSTYAYEGEEAGNPPLDKLAVDITQTIHAAEGAALQISIKEQKTSGGMQFDKQAGLMVSSEVKQVMALLVSYSGQSFDQKVNQATKVTLTPAK